jgi:hypothetical protein
MITRSGGRMSLLIAGVDIDGSVSAGSMLSFDTIMAGTRRNTRSNNTSTKTKSDAQQQHHDENEITRTEAKSPHHPSTNRIAP